MNYNNALHPKAFIPKIILGNILYGLFKTAYKKGDLLVLNYHSTPEWLMPEFEKQIVFFSNLFEIVDPSFLETFYLKKSGVSGTKPFLLFTFDDGLKNNLHAARILEKFGYHGLFFLVPDFLNTPTATQKTYYMQHIRNQVNFNIDKKVEDVSALNTDEIKTLIRNGHRIGSHSLSHTMHADDDLLKNKKEIIQSKNELESLLNITITDFCAPFDSLRSTNKNQMQLIRQHYEFFHATFPGSNSELPDPFFIRRTNVECWWPLNAIKFALSTVEWSRWQPERSRFRKEVL